MIDIRHTSGGVLFIAACFHPIYDHPACGPDGECPSGMTCSAQLICEASLPGGGVLGVWSFDSAAEFGAPGHAAKDMSIEGRGSLTPNAYTYGGLVAHGLQSRRLWARGDTSWAKLDGVVPSGAGMWRGERLLAGDDLEYLGITDQGAMTIWFEGEVWLEAGSNETFTINGDDIAFVALAPPGTTDYVQLTDHNTTVSVATPVTGWYPIRLGYGNAVSSSNFDFTHSDSAAGPVPWTRDRLRARTSELGGTLRTVFGRQLLGGGQGAAPPVMHLDGSGLFPMTTFDVPLQGGGTDDWSARYAGQVYITQPGAYALRITSDDGCRGRLGATGHAESHWGRDDGSGNAVSVTSADLAAGWNDVTVDYNQIGGGTKLRVQLGGPDLVDPTEVPRDRLRPVEPADDRLVFGDDDTQHTILDNGGAGQPGTAAMAIAGYPGETVTSIDVTYAIDSDAWDQLKVDLETPAGTRLTIRGTGGGDADGIAQQTIAPASPAGLGALLGGPAKGTWKLHAYDVAAGGGASLLTSAALTLHTTGGPDKVARTASWTSQVLDTQTDVFAIDGVTWDARLPAGATLEVRIGTCRQVNCSDVTWSPPVARQRPVAVGTARYLQLRVDMTSDGAREPELRSLLVVYRGDPGR